MTPDEAKAYVLEKCAFENWKAVKIEGVYYREVTIRRGAGAAAWSMTKLIPDGNDTELEKFWVQSADALQGLLNSGIVK